ncbi:unnamed protein product [Thlaspi arvense]|uniref:Secreted protein n=1 Tax=Thlaspi arvense TaxID=13288 RepID=A0AAU9R8M5_THLAR|nr:unnamed protein product [Thlaspi arvense]
MRNLYHDPHSLILLLLFSQGDCIQDCIRGKLMFKFQHKFDEGLCHFQRKSTCFQNIFYFVNTCEALRGDSKPLTLLISFLSTSYSRKHMTRMFLLVHVIGEAIRIHNLIEITVRNASCKLLNLQLKSF